MVKDILKPWRNWDRLLGVWAWESFIVTGRNDRAQEKQPFTPYRLNIPMSRRAWVNSGRVEFVCYFRTGWNYTDRRSATCPNS